MCTDRILAKFAAAAVAFLSLVLPAQAQSDRAGLIGEQFTELIESQPLQPTDGDDEMRKLLIQRFNIALSGLKNAHARFLKGTANLTVLFDNARRVYDTQQLLVRNKAEQESLLKKYLAMLKDLERILEAHANEIELPNVPPILIRVRYALVTARMDLLHLERNEPMETNFFNP